MRGSSNFSLIAGRSALLTLGVLFLSGGGGCELAGLMGRGTEEAKYVLPKDKRILVLVDIRPELSAPPAFATTLAERISSHLFRNKATDHVVPQQRLLELQQQDPAKFAKMGVADVANAVDADLVVVVYVIFLQVQSTTEGAVTQGNTQVLVKVVNSKGERLWPGDPAGTRIDAFIEPALSSDQDKTAVYDKLSEQLITRVGRLFHKYSLDDKTMTLGDPKPGG